jgi:integrase
VLGAYPALSLIDARKRARDTLGKIAEGIDPKKQEREQREGEASRVKNNFEAVANKFVKKHASKNRSGDESERIIDLYLKPTFGAKQIEEIKRRDIASLLDQLEAGDFKAKDGRKLGGPVMADRVLAQLRKLMNWHAARDDEFVNPIVKGMARTKPRERDRRRVLNDDEIRALWKALDNATPESKRAAPDLWAAFVKVLLLSAQRRDEVVEMARSEFVGNDWAIPPERHKTGKITGQPQIVPLSKAARALIGTVPVINESDLVFTTNGETTFSGFSKAKARLDRDMLAELRKAATARSDAAMIARVDEVARLLVAASKGDKKAREKLKTAWWTLHDLRRTAKTLMQRAGVLPHISERVLGHVIAGVEGVYDCWEYVEQKREALEKLASTVEQILFPSVGSNVVSMKGRNLVTH